ncbi:MAG TPA: aminoacyl-tRNA hydrolase [Stellaceae bacterium]|jgi:PTH1 family peptidyl-tRNA hydrolase|nr:aminoacyl-tRNA hydrolase [Stellaceae bacterium]
MRLLVGLGNPGPRHERNRHNIGFMAVEALLRRHEFRAVRNKFDAHLAEGMVGGDRILVMMPQTFMNESGAAVGPAARFYKIDPAQVAVIYDEVDLAPGKLRVKQGGGSAGHNGIRSIDANLGYDYWRVRLGIGHPGVKELVPHWVLQNFTAEDMKWVTPLTDAVAEAMPILVADDPAGFMSKVALILTPPKPKPAREEKVENSKKET